jgi:NitT/TauT family transport system permease protein
LLVWFTLAALLRESAVAGPVETLQAVVEGFSEDDWLVHYLGTLLAMTISVTIACALGLTLGIAFGLNRFWGAVMDGPLLWLYSIPKITLYPVFLLTLGLTLESRVAFAVFHGWIPLVLFTATGVAAVSPTYMKVAKVYRLTKSQTLRRIILPSALPTIVVGLRYCFSLTFIGLIFGEMFASTSGMGYEVVRLVYLGRTAPMFGIALVLILTALLFNAGFLALQSAIERRR